MTSKNVAFSIASPDDIRALSVVEINSTRLTRVKSKLPEDHGVLSLLMGSLDRRVRCTTCENDTLTCPGHFGHIEFAAPVYHFGFVKRISKALRTLCYWCCWPLACPNAATPHEGAPRRRETSRESTSTCERSLPGERNLRCVSCTGAVARYTVEGHRIKIAWPDSVPKKSGFLKASKALSIFERTLLQPTLEKVWPDYDLLRKLKNAILTVLIVPPPCIRPSVVQEKSSKVRGQDDLTRLLVNIVTVNNRLRVSMENGGKPDAALLAELQWTVSSYMHNDIRGERKATNRTGGATRDIRTRLVGKSGRVRNTLMGKRVNYSARDVITPSVAIDVDQVGVPFVIAETLLKPVLVTAINLVRMTELLGTGTVRYVHVVEPDGTVRRVLANKESLPTIPPLQVGWKVERTMLDGDYVCMNRHPSLHRVSMMGHRAKILPPGNLTFQMNPAVCPPYNCDFDGDEMNLHLATTVEADAELQEILCVSKNIVSPQNSRISIGAVQDCALGLYLLSDESLEFPREDAFQLMYSGGTEEFRLNVPHTGRGVISCFLPPDFCFTAPGTSGVQFTQGVLVAGRMVRANIHATIVAVALDYSTDIASSLLGFWQRLACYYVTMRGFSISMDDFILEPDSAEAVQSYLDATLERIDASPADDSVKNAALGSILGNLGSLAARHTTDRNSIVAMSVSGAKGNSINLTQIRCAVGQQNVNGRRTLGALPAFGRHDASCTRFGFVRSSYSQGLSPTEFFHHAMSGREGIVDTAVKTAETGYLGRRLAKGFESVRTLVDQSVRNAFGEILQFEYGNDGYDPAWLELVSLQGYYTAQIDSPSAVYCRYRDLIIDYFSRRPTRSRSAYMPCDPARLLSQAEQRSLANNKGSLAGDRRSLADTAAIEAALATILATLGGSGNHSTVVFQAAIVHAVSVCPAITEAALRWTMRELSTRFFRARVSPGEMVGIVAAQSIAQPATQLTLNTFHYAGVVAFNVTLGLPRLKELTDATSESQSPSMVIPLKQGTDEKALLRAFSPVFLKQIILGPLLASTRPDVTSTGPDMDCIELDMDRCVALRISPWFVLQRLRRHWKLPESNNGGCSMPSEDRWFVWVPAVPEKPRSRSTFEKIRLSGVESLAQIADTRVHATTELSRCTPYLLDCVATPRTLLTSGSSLEAIFGNAQECLDINAAYTNNLHEIYACLGVEAASAMLFFELRQVLSFDGTFVHDRHFQLIVDVMTHSGAIVPLSRHGLNKNMNTGILARASFEATVDQLLDGALRGEVDYLRGVSENIFLGLFPPMGTGTFDTRVRENYSPSAVVTRIPGKHDVQQGHVRQSLAKPLSSLLELDRVFHLANLLVPYEAPGFSLSGFARPGRYEETVPDATRCSQICSQMNEVTAPRTAQYRPSSPMPFHQFETVREEVDVMSLFSSIFGQSI